MAQAKEIGHVHGKRRARVDWQQLGLLAERLQQLQEAEMAYRCCVRVGFDPLVWERLMQLYATARYVSEPLVCAVQLCNYHTLRLSTNAEKEVPPPSVQRVMCGLVAVHGLFKVRTGLQLAAAQGGCPQMMHNMLGLIAKQKCQGFNR